MASTNIVRGKTLPDSGVKNDLHELIDLSTVTVSNIVNADVDTNAAIAGSKISPNFGSQSIIGGDCALTAGALLTEQTAPTTAAGQGAVYTKDTGGQPELFYREESDGDEVQITSGGALNVTTMGAYETTDASQVGGSTTTLANATEYQASVQGYVVAQVTASGWIGVRGQVGQASGVYELDVRQYTDLGGSTMYATLVMPVAKNEYWRIDKKSSETLAIYFKPVE